MDINKPINRHWYLTISEDAEKAPKKATKVTPRPKAAKNASMQKKAKETPKKDTDATKTAEFAKKRHAGALKITETAKEKGGPSLLTYHHFKVKLSYYKKMMDGNINIQDLKTKLSSLTKSLSNHVNAKNRLTMVEFQEIVGKIEVIGEILIYLGDADGF